MHRQLFVYGMVCSESMPESMPGLGHLAGRVRLLEADLTVCFGTAGAEDKVSSTGAMCLVECSAWEWRSRGLAPA